MGAAVRILHGVVQLVGSPGLHPGSCTPLRASRAWSRRPCRNPSRNVYAVSFGLALATTEGDSGLMRFGMASPLFWRYAPARNLAYCQRYRQAWQYAREVTGALREAQARKNRVSARFQECCGMFWESNLVEAGGIEPPSEGAPRPALHA